MICKLYLNILAEKIVKSIAVVFETLVLFFYRTQIPLFYKKQSLLKYAYSDACSLDSLENSNK